MKQKCLFVSLLTAVFVLIAAPSVAAVSNAEHEVEMVFTEVAPIYMENHAFDDNWIEGFTVRGRLIAEGVACPESGDCTFEGEMRLMNPPGDFTGFGPSDFGTIYDTLSVKLYNHLPIARWEVTGTAVLLHSSTTTSHGDVVVAFSGNVANGSGYLAGTYGLAAGNAEMNIVSGAGSGRMICRIRQGF